MRILFIGFFFLCFSSKIHAQPANVIDSLKTALEEVDNDYQKVDILINLGKISRSQDMEGSIVFFREAAQIANKNKLSVKQKDGKQI